MHSLDLGLATADKPATAGFRHTTAHQRAMTAFQAYNDLYNSSIVPLLTQQKDVEAVMLDVEAKGHLDAEVTHHPTASHALHTQLAPLPYLSWQAC